VRRLADAGDAITVTGTVPDVRPYLEAASLVVVPLRVGGGTRLKIYEAMSMDRPVVSTTIGAEGLPLAEAEHIIRADDPAAFAAACVRLLQAPGEAWRMARAGGEYVRSSFGWDRVAGEFAQLCAEADSMAGLAPQGQQA
jgi:glycosyltransferase involved in cell wall biosynthesis